MGYKVLYCDLDKKKNLVTIHIETLSGERVDVVVEADKGETWQAQMDAAAGS